MLGRLTLPMIAVGCGIGMCWVVERSIDSWRVVRSRESREGMRFEVLLGDEVNKVETVALAG